MPLVLREKGYRFSFYEADLAEPPHVHVTRESMRAKYWLDPIALERSRGFARHQLGEIERILVKYREGILNAWEKEQEKRGDR